jgi:hypothetical protein
MLLTAVGLSVGIFVGHVLWKPASHEAVPDVIEGTVTGVTDEGRRIGFSGVDGRQGEGIPVDITCWTDKLGVSQCGTPPDCLRPGTFGQRVELAVVDLTKGGGWQPRIAVWVHCLE